MLEKLKSYWQMIMGGLVALLSLAFLYERSKRKAADAIADNKEDLDKINELNKQISSNDGKLEAEESKRKELEKEAADAKSDNSTDASEFLKKR